MTAEHVDKRRRIERVVAACDLCKRRKVKCDGVRQVSNYEESTRFALFLFIRRGSGRSEACFRVHHRLTALRHNLAPIAKGRTSHLHVPSRLLRNVAKYSLLATLPMTPSHAVRVVRAVELKVKETQTERREHLSRLLELRRYLLH
jgi:hypothetical protein